MIHTNALRGVATKTATVISNDPNQKTVQLTIKVNVKTLVDVEPGPYIAIQAQSDQAAEGKVTIVNRDKTPLKILGVDLPSQDFTSKLRTLEDGKKYELAVHLKPRALGGQVAASLTLRTNNTKVPNVVIPVNAIVNGRVQATPQLVDFGLLEIGKLDTTPLYQLVKPITIRSNDKTFQVQSVRSTLPFVKPELTPPPQEGAPYRIKVTLLKEKVKKGKIDGSIIIATNDMKLSEVKIPVKGEIN